MHDHPTSRRNLMAGIAATVVAGQIPGRTVAASTKPHDLIGITTSSLSGHFAGTGGNGVLPATDLPPFVRNELGMTVIDFNSRTLGSFAPQAIETVRQAIDRAGCRATNIKINEYDLDIGAQDADTRRHVVEQCYRWIDAARLLGARWVRPIPVASRPNWNYVVDSYRRLIDYGRRAEPHVELLVENYNWLSVDPHVAARLVKSIGDGASAAPDTGNWKSEADRQAGLAAMFPLAETCDFKARELGADGEHAAYDLRRAFDIGWQSGFRGYWCLEHANRDRAQLVRDLTLLGQRLAGWMGG